jgi:hypothetical protein
MPSLKPSRLRIPEAVEYSKISRSRLYELAGQHPGLFVKNGSATLVVVEVLDRLLDAQPAASLKKVRESND